MKNYLDLYSVPVNFTYHNYYLYPSYWGGLFSLILECLLVAYLVFLLYDMSEREFPELAIHTIYDYDPNQIEIVTDNSLGEPIDIKSSEEEHKSYWYTAIGIKRNGSLVSSSTFGDFFNVTVKQMSGVCFEKNQRALFYSVSKPTIKEDDNNNQENQVKESDNKEVQEYQDIQDIYNNLLTMILNSKGKLEDYQVRLLELMGRTPEEIQILNNIISGKPMNYAEHSTVSEKKGTKEKKKDVEKINNEGNNETEKEVENSNVLIEKALEDAFWNNLK